MALLDSVNRVRRLLRDDVYSTLSSNDLDAMTLVDFLNDAADELFAHRVWSFLKRYDGQVWLPGAFTVTAGGVMNANATSGSLNFAGANAWATANVVDFTARGQDGRLRPRIVWNDDTEHPSTSYSLSQLSVLPNFPFVQTSAFRGVQQNNGGWTLYANEYVLPSTVRQVLSVVHEERPLNLEFVDRDFDFVSDWPRSAQWLGEPEMASVGGTLTGCGTDAGITARTGLGLTVWPAPQSEVLLKYSYVYRYARLSADADDWTGVPAEHVRLIESMAFERSLWSNVEDDPRRATVLHAHNEKFLARLTLADQRMVNQRRITPTLGGDGGGRGKVPRYQIVLTS